MTTFEVVEPIARVNHHTGLLAAIADAYRVSLATKRIVEVRVAGELVVTVFPQTVIDLSHQERL